MHAGEKHVCTMYMRVFSHWMMNMNDARKRKINCYITLHMNDELLH